MRSEKKLKQNTVLLRHSVAKFCCSPLHTLGADCSASVQCASLLSLCMFFQYVFWKIIIMCIGSCILVGFLLQTYFDRCLVLCWLDH